MKKHAVTILSVLIEKQNQVHLRKTQWKCLSFPDDNKYLNKFVTLWFNYFFLMTCYSPDRSIYQMNKLATTFIFYSIVIKIDIESCNFISFELIYNQWWWIDVQQIYYDVNRGMFSFFIIRFWDRWFFWTLSYQENMVGNKTRQNLWWWIRLWYFGTFGGSNKARVSCLFWLTRYRGWLPMDS